MIKGPRGLKFDSMISNAYILVSNRCLAVITYQTKLQCSFTTSFAANNSVNRGGGSNFTLVRQILQARTVHVWKSRPSTEFREPGV